MTSPSEPLRIAVVGAGPAGIYASDILVKSDIDVEIDLYERMPAPFGLIRYGVAPDHPRIKGIVKSLHRVLDQEHIELIGNVEVGADIAVDEMRQFYDAIIFSTGATEDKDLNIPGMDAEGTFGAGEFVGFYDGNPNFRRDWDLDAEKVAVIGVGNVALDIARILAKTADELRVTEIPDNVYDSLAKSRIKEVHIFGRRGPAQVKFTPQELKELDHSPNVEVIVDPEDIDYDEASEEARREKKAVDQVAQILEGYAMREPKNAIHKLYIHLFHQPTEVLTENGKVVGIRTERTELNGSGGAVGTGEFHDWDVQQVYRAVGYRPQGVEGVPFDPETAVMPNDGGRVLTEPNGAPVPGLYTTGWIKRGPVGLIGNTKSDAKDTTAMLLEDHAAGLLATAPKRTRADVLAFFDEKDHPVTTWEGWHRLDDAERQAGETEGRERKKIVEWDDMLRHSGPQYQI